jgi:tetratricopeptide (TPR) repeat protein
MNLRKLLAAAAALLLTVLLAPAARAQLIDDLEFRRDGADAVLQVRFVTEVRYKRAAVARSRDFTQVFYDVLPTRQALSLATSERRIAGRRAEGGRPGLPAITVTDEPISAAGVPERRLLIRMDAPVNHRVRAGAGNRTFEVVIEGLGDAAAALARAPLVAGTEGPWRVTLLSSSRDGAYLPAAIPSSLQNEPVYTTRRVVDGQARYETHLGAFATRAQAEVALALLAPRFPDAQVSDSRAAAQPPVAAASAPASAPPAAPAAPTPAETAFKAAALLAEAKAAQARGDLGTAFDALSRLLDLPPNPSTREAQALIGDVRAAAGDSERARAEYELFLKLYPAGTDADRVRAALAALPAPAPAPPPAPLAPTAAAGTRQVTPTTTLTGSASAFYYGGQSKVRTQEFQDSPLSGLPELVSDATLSGTDQKQVVGSVDVNWRHRDAEVDQRFVLRDTYTRDLLDSGKSKNRLSALYFEHRSLPAHTSLRIGRQSPLGGGVLGRFDGAQVGYGFAPRWKVNFVGGVPTDELLDARRHFYGASIDAEALTPQLGGSVYVIQQVIDGEIDRRALGSDLRWFDGGLSATGQVDYDILYRALNIASLQGTWQREDNTVVNVLYDRRRTPLLMLGNALFFTDPNLTVRPTTIGDLLATKTVRQLQQQVVATTAVSTQAAIAVTTPVSPRWQLGADIRYSNTGAILPVPDILPGGLPSTGDIWSVGAQAIGTNLYSARDTHVFIVNAIQGPAFKGQLFSYNNSSLVNGLWQLEPSLKYYRQSDDAGLESTRWSPGMRVTYRLGQQVALESEVSVERSKVTGPSRHESASRVFYYLGGRYDF